MSQADHYAELGVTVAASEAEIRTAYRRLAKRFHPDLNPGDPAAEQRFKTLTAAYDVLSDADRRRYYDLHLRRSAASPDPTAGPGQTVSPGPPASAPPSRPTSAVPRPVSPPGPETERWARLGRIQRDRGVAEAYAARCEAERRERQAAVALWEGRVNLARTRGHPDLAEQAVQRAANFRQLAEDARQQRDRAQTRAQLLGEIERELLLGP
jgi:curved DNA-binding protein CbpA